MNYGDIYLVDFALSFGHEYRGKRPAIIIQSDQQLKKTNMVTVMPITSQISKNHSDDIAMSKDDANRLMSDSLIKVHHIKSFDRERFVKKIGVANDKTMKNIRDYLRIHFGL